MKRFLIVFIVATIFLFPACHPDHTVTKNMLQDTLRVAWNNPHIHAMGRINRQGQDYAVLYWPGTSLKIRFKGTKVETLLKDEKGKNYYDIIVDGGEPRLLHPDSLEHWYVLADSLDKKEHTLELFKRTEWSNGNTRFYDFRITKRAKLLDSHNTSGRVIEFYGNSITAGYADRDSSGNHPDSILTDNYVAYGGLTARHYHADYYCTSKGGIGIMISWFPMIMPEMYNRLDPTDPQSKWDFSKVQPNIVVINLFQNDSWLVKMPDYPEFKHRFGKIPPTRRQIVDAYKSFVERIRAVYPKAHIICTLGSMDATKTGSPWPGYVTQAVKEIHDPEIYTLFFPYINKAGHPRVKDHRIMADTLIHFIDKNIKW